MWLPLGTSVGDSLGRPGEKRRLTLPGAWAARCINPSWGMLLFNQQGCTLRSCPGLKSTSSFPILPGTSSTLCAGRSRSWWKKSWTSTACWSLGPCPGPSEQAAPPWRAGGVPYLAPALPCPLSPGLALVQARVRVGLASATPDMALLSSFLPASICPSSLPFPSHPILLSSPLANNFHLYFVPMMGQNDSSILFPHTLCHNSFRALALILKKACV